VVAKIERTGTLLLNRNIFVSDIIIMKFLRISGIIVLSLMLIIGLIVVYVINAYPDTGPAPDITIEHTAARLQRGQYLANHVSICINCHSHRDWQTYSAPVTSGSEGRGGEEFGKAMGLPGTFYAPNITPYALAGWTDGEIVKAVTTGVSKDGRGMMPVMGYHRFGLMDKEDIYSIIAYIRTLPAIANTTPASKADFPINLLLHLMPHPAAFSKLPDESDHIAYGRYLVNAAACEDCHSKQDKAKLLAGSEFGGGRAFRLGGGITTSTNITTDKSGIAGWTRQAFVRRFKLYADSGYKAQKLKPDDFNTPMPWTMYAGMKSSDLEAIYDYLQTVKPVNNTVVKFRRKE
jgi:mono/diheme cytochrome c family protein